MNAVFKSTIDYRLISYNALNLLKAVIKRQRLLEAPWVHTYAITDAARCSGGLGTHRMAPRWQKTFYTKH